MSERLKVCEKRISAAMGELRAYRLIWEKRCGRGYANQIYLASMEVSLRDAVQSAGSPMDPLPQEIGIDETESLTENEDARIVAEQTANKPVDEYVDNCESIVDNDDISLDSKVGIKDVFSENEGKFPSEPQERP